MGTMAHVRSRHEHQINLNSTTFGGELDLAMARVMSRHPGLSFFTDEQISEIRAEMIRREWFCHKHRRENRKRRVA